jgi:hypothetical protein
MLKCGSLAGKRVPWLGLGRAEGVRFHKQPLLCLASHTHASRGLRVRGRCGRRCGTSGRKAIRVGPGTAGPGTGFAWLASVAHFFFEHSTRAGNGASLARPLRRNATAPQSDTRYRAPCTKRRLGRVSLLSTMVPTGSRSLTRATTHAITNKHNPHPNLLSRSGRVRTRLPAPPTGANPPRVLTAPAPCLHPPPPAPRH